MRELLRRIRKLLKDKRFRRLWYRGISTVAAIVVFFTTYALVLPAITMESEAHCGIPAHQHTSDCYEEELICGQEESDGHHHTDECYAVSKELTCTTPEHQHDESCFDEDGNLTCTQIEHAHDDTCYEEHRELTCTLEESEGHHHDSSCYKQVLTCGLEAHIHSTECYKEDSSAVTASTSIQASDNFDNTIATTAASTSVSAEIYDGENASNGSGTGDTTHPAADATQTNTFEKIDAADDFAADSATAESSSTAATTDVLPEPVEQETLSEGYVPTLDPVNMDQVLDKYTGFYYYHAEEGEDLPASSTEITSWKKVDDNTELAPTDLVKAYFAYTIPAGSLNETNQVARYRLPSNLHLTDDQIIAINQQENGVAAAYIDYDTLQILDTDNYHKYLGAEAIEGTRTPDQTLTDGAQEYISAVVKAENVYDDEGIYGEKGAYLGQDLIFIFTPYTIEKNQNTYDTDGNPTSVGQKVSGWFACDFNMGQIDWVEAENNTDHDVTAIEKTADILFAAQNDVLNTNEISQTLKLVERIESPEDAAVDFVGEAAEDDITEDAPAEGNASDEVYEEEVVSSATETDAEATDVSVNDTADTTDTAEANDTADIASTSEAEPEYKDGTLTATGDDYTITLDYTADACIPENAELKIREITKESDPEAYDACLEQAKEQVVDKSAEESTEIDQKASRFFDIEIVVKDKATEENSTAGEVTEEQKIEPKAPVNVNIQLSNVTTKTGNTVSGHPADKAENENKQNDPTVLHFAEHGVEQIDSTTNDGFREVGAGSHIGNTRIETSKDTQFEAESFSVYGVVYTSTITATYITASGETYEITVTYDSNAEIPDDATLNVREIEAETDEYKGYLNDSAEELDVANEEISFARFFDIEILDKNGVKIEPQTPVTVQIAYKDGVDTSTPMNIVHFADNNTEVITDVAVSDDGKEIVYVQNSFSVTGTIQTGNPTNGGIYMVIVEYNGKHYMVNNDGTLSEITYGQDASGHPDNTKVSVEYPMFWTYYYQYGGHLRFASEASGFNADQTASGYYYKYIDPNSEEGIVEENKNGAGTNLLGTTVIAYHDNTISNAGYNKYIGVVNDGGVLRISGNVDASHAAKIELASPGNVLPSDPLKHSVNHIDIGIDGAADVTVPLAYGRYSYTDGNGNTQTFTVDQDHLRDVMLHAGKDEITVTSEDMKGAEIKAYLKTDYERYKDNPEELANHELNDVFYITGYSANDTTAFSEVQVRVEGSFKVAYGIADANNNYYNWWWYQNYINQVKQQRLSHQVEYTVSLNKTITLPVTIDGHQLYDDQDQPLYVTVDIPLKDSFSYWDTENECPPVQWDWSNWQSGDIATHGMSGMDFRLDGGTVQVRANSVAINITKYIEDTEGNPIKVASNITNRFEIFRDVDGNPDTVKNNGSENVNYEDYSHYHYKDITISPGSDSNLVHDYQVTPGMYYIKEDESTIPEYITEYTGDSSEGQQWKYKSTEILTEYVWRGGADIGTDSKGRLEITHTNSNGDQYVSIPDVLGTYSVDGQGRAPDNNGNYHDLYNGFLEFYVINKYEKVENIEEPEEGNLNIHLEKKWEDNGQEIDAPSDNEASVQFKLHKIKKTTTKNGSSGGSSGGGTGTSTGEYTVNLYYANGGSPATSTSWDGTSAIPLSFIVKGDQYSAPSTNINYDSRYGPWTGININHDHYQQVNIDGQYGWKYDGNISIDKNKANASKVVTLYFSDDPFKQADGFIVTPVLGSGGSTPSQPNVTTEESEETVTLSNSNEWAYTFENLPARYEDNEKIEEYSYYLEEISGSQTGGASSFTKVEFKDSVGSETSPIEGKDWYNKEDRTVTITATNEKASLTVEKEWRGEEDTVAYPPIKFQLYQGWENGDVVSEGWLYTEATNNEVDSNGAYTIRAEDAWKIEFFNLPTTATHDGRTGKVGYYVVEVDPRDGTNWFTNPHVKKNYQNSNGNFDNAGNQPYNAGLAGNTGTLTIINTMPKYDSLEVQKKWYENDNGSWTDISENPTKTSDYAFGFMVQRQVDILGTDGVTVVQTIPYEDYGSEILVSQDKVLLNNNDFTVSYNGSLWLFKVEGNDDIARHENNLVGEGYYQKDDGSRAWAKFSYKFVEVDAYKLSTVQNGSEVAPRDQWETIACNPEYGTSGDGKRAIISNYPIGEMRVKKIWENDDPNLEIGNKVYFKVFQNGDNITPDIVAHPSKYGLFSNQIYDDPVNDDHDSVVIAYDGTEWETVTIKGLNIFDRTHGDAQNQYSVQEIGYSDQKNQDFWDVRGFLKGYMVDDPSLAPSMDNERKSTAIASDPVKTVFIKNEYIKKDTEIKFTKVWQNNLEQGISWQKPITVTLHQRKGTRDQAANGQGTTTGKTAEITLDPYGMGQNAPGSEDPGSAPSAPEKTFTFDGKTYEWSMEVTNEGAYYTFIIEGLPYRENENYEATDNYLSYYVTESSLGTEFETKYKTEQESGGSGSTTVSLVEKPSSDQTAKNGEYIFNIQKAGSLKITKSVTENGSTTLSDSAKEALAGTYTFTLYKDGDCTKPYQEAVEKQVEEGGATVTKTVMEDKTVTITIGSDGSSVTSPEITGLPAGDYWIKETDPENTAIKPVTNPVKVTVEADKTGNAAVVAEFTNNLKSTGIKIIKIDETTRGDDAPQTLGNAYFKLYQLTGETETNEGTYTVYPDADHCEGHTNSSGTLEFSSLPKGKYMVEETKSPDGYIKEQEVKFYFTVTDEGVDWTDEYGKNTITSQNLVSYVPNTVTFTVGNVPGAALPSAGGPGIRIFYLLGGTLILAALALLAKKQFR